MFSYISIAKTNLEKNYEKKLRTLPFKKVWGCAQWGVRLLGDYTVVMIVERG